MPPVEEAGKEKLAAQFFPGGGFQERDESIAGTGNDELYARVNAGYLRGRRQTTLPSLLSGHSGQKHNGRIRDGVRSSGGWARVDAVGYDGNAVWGEAIGTPKLIACVFAYGDDGISAMEGDT